MIQTTKAGPHQGEPATVTQVLARSQNVSSVSRPTVPDWAATALEHAHAVVLDVGEGRTRRHVYLSLPAAEKAISRAKARGHRAVLVLVRLVVEEHS